MNSELSISIKSVESSSISDRDDIWINIEQKIESDEGYADFNDIINMLAYSSSGIPSALYNRNCSISIDDSILVIPVQVYVWPSYIDMPYSIEILDAENTSIPFTVSPGRRVSEVREESVVIEMEDEKSWKYLIQPVSSSWEMPAFNKFGKSVPTPSYEISRNKLKLSSKVLSSMRLRYIPQGYIHTLFLQFDNTEQGIKRLKDLIPLQDELSASINSRISIADLTVVVTSGDYGGETGLTNQGTITIPKNITNCLSECDHGLLLGDSIEVILPTDGSDNPNYSYWRDIYYSTCSGKILAINNKKVR